MKNLLQTPNLLTRFTFALALAGWIWLPAAGVAQEKGATQLMRSPPARTVADRPTAKPGDASVRSCSQCKDSWGIAVEKTFKAVQPEIKRPVQRHECPGCVNTIVTEGHGKAKVRKVIHGCNQCGSQ